MKLIDLHLFGEAVVNIGGEDFISYEILKNAREVEAIPIDWILEQADILHRTRKTLRTDNMVGLPKAVKEEVITNNLVSEDTLRRLIEVWETREEEDYD